MKASLIKTWVRQLTLLWPIVLSAEISGAELELKTDYLFDFLVTDNWEQSFTYRAPVTPGLTLRGGLHFRNYHQDVFMGLRSFSTSVISGLGGLSWTTLMSHLVIDVEGGVDQLINGPPKPRGIVTIKSAIPLPPNGIVRPPRLTAEGWYQGHASSAPMIRNEISSSGFALDLTTTIARQFEIGGNYRRESLRPKSALLDTSFKEPVLGGVPPDTLHDNIKESFYAFAYRTFMNIFTIGYAFSWTDTEVDRWVATRVTPVMFQGFPPRLWATAFEYANYPYSTPRKQLSHLAVLSLSFPLGERVRCEQKVSFPVYSRREQFSSPDTIPVGEPVEPYSFYFTMKNAGPLLLSTKLRVRFTDAFTTRLEYQYFSLPYEPWGYVSKNQYSYHQITLTLGLSF